MVNGLPKNYIDVDIPNKVFPSFQILTMCENLLIRYVKFLALVIFVSFYLINSS